MEAEAWENYVFDAMVTFDADLMEQLVVFRSSLFVVPPPPGGQDPAQVQAREARTNAIWAGYRRVYFGVMEPEPSHEQVMDRLRTEIADLHQLAAHTRELRGDDEPSSLFRDNHNDDDEGVPSSTGVMGPRTGPDLGSSGGDSNGSNGNDDGNSKDGDNRGSGTNKSTGHALVSTGPLGLPDPADIESPIAIVSGAASLGFSPLRRVVLLSLRTLRRILAAKESLFKFGTFVPKNDREADSSPEATKWNAGRTLEWVRLGQQETFDGDWTWAKVQEFSRITRRQKSGFCFTFTISSFRANIVCA